MRHRIDAKNAPSDGPHSVDQQEIRLRQDTERIVKDAWEKMRG